MSEPKFLAFDDVVNIHAHEIAIAGGIDGIRDLDALHSAIGAPLASFEGRFLMSIFEMAATYANSIALNHPFLDGNKRAALASALTFLYMNGYEFNELYDEELADKMLELVTHQISKKHLSDFFEQRCIAVE